MCPGLDRCLLKVVSELSPYFNFLSQIFACTSTSSPSGTSQANSLGPTDKHALSFCLFSVGFFLGGRDGSVELTVFNLAMSMKRK